MNADEILSAIDEQISRLEQARALLEEAAIAPSAEASAKKRRGRPPGSIAGAPAKNALKKSTMSAEGRARIAAAQKKRWAAKHAATKAAGAGAGKSVVLKAAAKKVSARPAPAKKSVPAKTAVKNSVPAKAAAKAAPAKKSVPVKKAVPAKAPARKTPPAKAAEKPAAAPALETTAAVNGTGEETAS